MAILPLILYDTPCTVLPYVGTAVVHHVANRIFAHTVKQITGVAYTFLYGVHL